ncbi:MAG: high frequency lysogenization protein HflD [Gammaproteobacteria bacterium]|nr:high frequency lysogenization protein HflD [Gammaproteobacteria bacterium]MCP5299798.1 high frequency lysogenization protein HflD [Chromatiaceae bacterium]
MSAFRESDRVVALGGIFQAASLARDLARTGACNALTFRVSRNTLFEFEPETVASIFGGLAGVEVGLRTLGQQLERSTGREMEISRYVVALLHLADRLLANQAAPQALHDDLVALQRRIQHFDLGEPTLNEQLAVIYQERISTLGPRIMVRGEPLHLQNADNAARIRVALLSGVRAAVLWRQAGGKKWQLLLRRRAIAASCRELVDRLTS